MGGLGGCGTVFTLTNSGNGWRESILYSFSGGADGLSPWAGVTLNKTNLYGTTYYGGGDGCAGEQGCGTVFELKESSEGWTEYLVYSFSGSDGAFPIGGRVIFDRQGNLYGTTSDGGTYGIGNVFQVTP